MEDSNDTVKTSKQIKYHAFISYRHADNKQQGRQWATWLHQSIETYEVPADLVGKNNARGEKIPARIYPVFRDEEELPANSDLGSSIVGALDLTQILVVLCSPRAVASTYVADEIDYFKSNCNGSERIIAAMIDGEPNTSWDKGKLASGFKVSDECFPIPLRFEYDTNGNRTERYAEPIAADFRINNHGLIEQGWTSPEALRLHLKSAKSLSKAQIEKRVTEYQTQQHLMLLKIIAGILGVPLGELTQRDKQHQLEQARQKTTKLRKWLTAVGFFALLAVGAGFVAYVNQQEAIKQTREAQELQSKTVAQNAIDAFERGEYHTSISLALSALPESFSNPDRGFSADAEAILSSAIFHDKLIYSGIGDPSWSDLDWLRKDPYKSFISSDQTRLIIYGSASPVIIDLISGTRITLEEQPSADFWSSWTHADISKTGQLIAVQGSQNDKNLTYVWSTVDGQLILKQPAKFSKFDQNQKFAGFYNKDPKTKKTEGYLVEINQNKTIMDFAGEFTGVSESNGLVLTQEDKKCRFNLSTGRVCESVTHVFSIKSGELLLSINGALVEGSLNDDYVLLKNSSDVNAKTQSNTSLVSRNDLNANGVAKWDLKAMQQIAFYPGNFEYFNPQFKRMITVDGRRNKSNLWNIGQDALISEIDGYVVSLDGYERLENRNNTLIYDWDDIPMFITSVKVKSSEETLKYSLVDGQLISRTPGSYLGQFDTGRIVTQRLSDGLYDIFEEDSSEAMMKMVSGFCSNDVYEDSSRPLMPNVSGSAIIFNCGRFIALYYPNSANTNKPHIITSDQPAQWVEDGNLFWFGKDNAELFSFSYWEGGVIHPERILRLPVVDSITFRSLLNGKYLLALTPDSKISLWDSSGSIFKPIITIDEFELSKGYLSNFNDKERSTEKINLNNKLELISQLGFNTKEIHKADDIGFEERKDTRWSLKKEIESDSIYSNSKYKADFFVELRKGKVSVVFGDQNAYLVNRQNGVMISQLYKGSDYSESFFNSFSEPFGVSESPNGKHFIFFNWYGVWLFDMHGNIISVLCDDEASCSDGVDFNWIGDGNQVHILGKNPHIYSFVNKNRVDLCKSYLKKDNCRRALSGSIIFGENTIATGRAIFDLKTGIRLLELPGDLGGMYAHPFRFNDDESAVLMVSETGGGTSLYGIWRLPERGEALLSKVRAKIKSID